MFKEVVKSVECKITGDRTCFVVKMDKEHVDGRLNTIWNKAGYYTSLVDVPFHNGHEAYIVHDCDGEPLGLTAGGWCAVWDYEDQGLALFLDEDSDQSAMDWVIAHKMFKNFMAIEESAERMSVENGRMFA